MKKPTNVYTIGVIAGLLGVLLLGNATALAHCDGMDGPVVKAAQKALETGNVNLVLIWVQKGDEAEIKKAFEQTVGVRKLSPEARQLADTWFFETLVRVHRAGEGAPYTGLKPAGRDLGPAIPAADKSIESGSADAVTKLVTEAVTNGIHHRFADVSAKKKYSPDDVEAGRAYVAAYVTYVHYVEGLYEASTKATHGGEHGAGHDAEKEGGHEHAAPAEPAHAEPGQHSGEGHTEAHKDTVGTALPNDHRHETGDAERDAGHRPEHGAKDSNPPAALDEPGAHGQGKR